MKNFAVIGGGLMGVAFAKRLLKLNFKVQIYARNKIKSTKTELLEIRSNCLKDVCTNADCIIIALKDYQAIKEVFEYKPSQKCLILQTATILPAESILLSQFFGEESYVEAPFMGSVNNALNGTINFLVACPDLSEKIKSFLHIFSDSIHYFGTYGKAACAKLAINQLIVSSTTAYCLSLAMIQKNNIPVDDFMKVLRQTHIHARAYDNRLSRFMEENYSNPNFEIANLFKDGKLAECLANSLNLDARQLAAASLIAEESINLQGPQADYGIIYEVIKGK